MVKDFLGIIKKPIDSIEKKLGGNFKKILIMIGIIVGIYFLADFISMMYSTVAASKDWNGKLHFEVLKNINYFKFILDFILNQVFFLGSIFAGLFVFTSISKKDLKLVDVLTIILVAFTLNYLVTAALDILFMFKFMNVKFLLTLRSIISTAILYYAIALLVIGIIKTYDAKINDKNFLNIAIALTTIAAVYELLSLMI